MLFHAISYCGINFITSKTKTKDRCMYKYIQLLLPKNLKEKEQWSLLKEKSMATKMSL